MPSSRIIFMQFGENRPNSSNVEMVLGMGVESTRTQPGALRSPVLYF
jgi:hypothetical protein